MWRVGRWWRRGGRKTGRFNRTRSDARALISCRVPGHGYYVNSTAPPGMLPSHYACTSCGERFVFADREALYYFNFDRVPLGNQLPGTDLFSVPVRPGWCKDCSNVCLVEDIAPVRAFENAYGAVKAGRVLTYPAAMENLTRQKAEDKMEAFLRWRMSRRHAPRALCCGRSNFQFLDIAQPLLKHAECDFGVVESQYIFPGSYNGPGPGVWSAANIRVYNGEGDLIGLLTWRDQKSDIWKMAPAAYPDVEKIESL